MWKWTTHSCGTAETEKKHTLLPWCVTRVLNHLAVRLSCSTASRRVRHRWHFTLHNTGADPALDSTSWDAQHAACAHAHSPRNVRHM